MRPLRAAGVPRRSATACFHTTAPSLARLQRPRVHEKKRPAEPLVPYSWRPFEVPEVVLDLDSWDNPIARPYDKDEMQTQRKKWEQNSIVDATWQRIRHFEYERQRDSEKFAKVSVSHPWYQHWQVTDLDIMTAALKGDSRVGRQTQNLPPEEKPHQNDAWSDLKSVASKNAIPLTSLQDDKNFLSWLLQRRPTTASLPLKRQREIRAFVRRLEDLQSLKRYLQFLLQHGEKGFQLCHNADQDITFVISRLLTKPPRLRPFVDLLPFINSIFALQRQHGLPVSPGLCGICLIISAKAFQLPAVSRYLKLGLKEGHWVGEGSSASDVKAAVEALIRCWDNRRRFPDVDRSGDIIRRLLGESLGEDSAASFKVVSQHHPEDEGLKEQLAELSHRVASAPKYPPAMNRTPHVLAEQG
ncbi:hypothetical protein HER10_EVM0003196 [Colletotrichum scovillei]|uniref:Methylmalonate-semialdehyde dehydrogenase n=1 Tax=Colletotrichum scovillei TaxID=1209932 RepID=A0A9P7R7T9_9PEZI|nr:uncharacterized protein HER10_EVM0003196 [Colletotrichum scovillei]KAF4782816.1 hypothetical protein HER10_EVM0003196 [Colletotrichum scovillei]KAG7051165.1 methylmalonate-semialdehyde dehydrogenase [Colletotrichum scovillei]KAG7070200.1 methylmalonate-semialdehyde dehydrogenase [Colletotrichum scovillei]KAG7078451.1 methylmalonate-semialdehyde dehydrogenase [Colletotrichum scovillei]